MSNGVDLLAVINTLCEISVKQVQLVRELVEELEQIDQVSQEVKDYYRCRLVEVDEMISKIEETTSI